jgi:hypothetical protein
MLGILFTTSSQGTYPFPFLQCHEYILKTVHHAMFDITDFVQAPVMTLLPYFNETRPKALLDIIYRQERYLLLVSHYLK